MPVPSLLRPASTDLHRGLAKGMRGVLTAAVAHFSGKRFTRRDLAHAMGWEINRITGRVLTLIERGELEELDERRDGSALIRIAAVQRELALA